MTTWGKLGVPTVTLLKFRLDFGGEIWNERGSPKRLHTMEITQVGLNK